MDMHSAAEAMLLQGWRADVCMRRKSRFGRRVSTSEG